MIWEILARILVYGYLFIAIAAGSIVASPMRLFVFKSEKLAKFFRRLNFISNWAIFTGMSSECYEIEVVATLKSGKKIRWFLSDGTDIEDLKIYTKTVEKNTLTFFFEYKYFHETIEERLLNYAFDKLKDPMVDLKIYHIKYNIDENINYFLRTQKRPKPNSPPKIGYEAKWEY